MPGIGLISREGSAVAEAAKAEAAAWLASNGRLTISLSRDSALTDHRDLDLIIAFGGDGTLLGVAHAVASAELASNISIYAASDDHTLECPSHAEPTSQEVYFAMTVHAGPCCGAVSLTPFL